MNPEDKKRLEEIRERRRQPLTYNELRECEDAADILFLLDLVERLRTVTIDRPVTASEIFVRQENARLREALKKICDPASALVLEPGRERTYADWELRNLARTALEGEQA